MKKLAYTAAVALFAALSVPGAAHAQTLTNAQLAAIVQQEAVISKQVTTLFNAVANAPSNVLGTKNIAALTQLQQEEFNLNNTMQLDGLPNSITTQEWNIQHEYNTIIFAIQEGASAPEMRALEATLSNSYGTLLLSVSGLDSSDLNNDIGTDSALFSWMSADNNVF